MAIDASKYWDVANTVTGASFAQMLLYLYGSGGSALDHRRLYAARDKVALFIGLGFPVYACILSVAAYGEWVLRCKDYPTHLIWLGLALRILMAASTTAVSVFATLRLTPPAS